MPKKSRKRAKSAIKRPSTRRGRDDATREREFVAAREREFVLTNQLEAPFDLYHHLPFRLATLTNLLALDRDIDIRTATTLGLRELRVLLNIGSYMPIRAVDIAYQTRLDTFTVSRAVKTLLAHKLITLQTDRRDRRAQNLSLTGAGEAEYRRVVAVLQARDRAFARVLSGAERRQLASLLGRLEELAESLLVTHAERMLERDEPVSADQREIIRWRKRSSGKA